MVPAHARSGRPLQPPVGKKNSTAIAAQKLTTPWRSSYLTAISPHPPFLIFRQWPLLVSISALSTPRYLISHTLAPTFIADFPPPCLDRRGQASWYRHYRQRSLKSSDTVRTSSTHTSFATYIYTTTDLIAFPFVSVRSLVAFGPKQRAIGEPAKTQETSNFRNTIGGLKRLIGRTVSDPEVQNVEKTFTNAALVDVNGTIGVEVKYLGQAQKFSTTQLVGSYLGKLRDIVSNELKVGVTDLVLAVPVWYTDIQRRAIIDAASIAGLNILRLINDTTATALGYGITKSDLPEAENPRHVIFIDVGHSSLSAAAVAFSKGQLTVKATAFDTNVGGRYIDQALVKHFAEQFKTKYKIDVLSNPKATFRLAAGCDKIKKVLSANTEAPLNVESIMNDIDASSKMTREEYETLIAGVLDLIPIPIAQVLQDSGLTLEQIDAIELVGGCTRIPAVRAKIQSVFPGKVLSTTLNQDEAIARGATFACAMLSPVFRVRDFVIHDIQPYPIKVEWEKAPEDPDEDTELVVFPKGNGIPSTKVLTFYRNKPFEIQASYAEPSGLPGGINPWIAKFTAKSVGPNPKDDLSCVKVKTRLNQHGLLSFEAAYTEEVEEVEESPMAVDGEPEAAPKKKKIVKKTDVPFVWGSAALDKTIVESLREQEAEMHAADKLVVDTEVR
jgi:heat shock protein 4